MEIKEITVHAGRTIPHPTESYANLRPSITLRAELHDGDSPHDSVKQLQKQAEMLVEEHSTMLVAAIEEREVIQREADEINRLESTMHQQTQRLTELREAQEKRTEPPWLEWPNKAIEDRVGI